MKRMLGVFAAVLVFSVVSVASAQEVSAAADTGKGGFLSSLRFGLHVDLGMTNTVGDLDDEFEDFLNEEATARFTMGLGLFGQYFLTDMLALDVGLGFVGKGFQVQPTHDDEYMQKWTYLEIPLGVLADIKGLQVGLALALEFALSGKVKLEEENEKHEYKWNDDEWDHYLRFNLAPKLTAGYAIPLELVFGTLYLIPGLDFSIHLIDEHQGNELAVPDGITGGFDPHADDDDISYRSWNLMFRIGAALKLN